MYCSHLRSGHGATSKRQHFICLTRTTLCLMQASCLLQPKHTVLNTSNAFAVTRLHHARHKHSILSLVCQSKITPCSCEHCVCLRQVQCAPHEHLYQLRPAAVGQRHLCIKQMFRLSGCPETGFRAGN
eukprot:scaffold3616_cov22-Tisochrysis_lutea.AAC.4